MARRYARDNKGRFSSTGATARGGRLRTSSGSKRATVTAKASGAAPKGTISKTKRNKPATAANSIRPMARSKPAASKIVPITRKKKPTIKEKAKEVKGLMRKMGRSQTREALSSSNLDREIARQSGATKVARTTVQRRQQRAFNVQNGRNPRIGSKALYVYQSQLKELGSTSNKRVPFRRKPMTETQAKKAASARNAADQKRLLKAINADTESRMTRAPKPAAAAPKPAATAKSRAAKPAAAAARTAAPKPAASKSTARPLSQRETQNLGLAKSNLAISKERLAFAREAKAKAKGPLEKLKATDRINEHQTNIRELNKKITAINARPAPGRPITGADRSGNRKQLSAPKKSGAIKGSIKRDASASSKLKNKSGLNAGKFKNIYMANANKAAAAKRKRNP